jgi:hypothetical protein
MKLAVTFPGASLVLLCACGSGHDFGSPNPPDGDGDDSGTSSSNKDAAPPPNGKDGGTTTTPDAGSTGVPTLEIVSGNGGTVPSGWPATDPLRVRARDAQGNPVPNADVKFQVGAGQGLHLQNLNGDTVQTDADGVASVTYNAFPIDANKGHESDTVTASWNGLSVQLGVIITQVPSGQWAAPPLFYIKTPEPDLGTAKAGSTVTAAIQILGTFQQGPDYNQGVPGFGLRLTSTSDSLTDADLACTGGTALADAQGNVTCDIVAPQAPGDYYFSALAGGQIKWDMHLKVTP